MFLTKLWFRLMRIFATGKTGTGLYYIGGPDVLPQPLSREEEATVIQVMEAGGDGAESARQTLIERNLRLVAFIARRYENPPTAGVNIEDLISIGSGR